MGGGGLTELVIHIHEPPLGYQRACEHQLPPNLPPPCALGDQENCHVAAVTSSICASSRSATEDAFPGNAGHDGR